MKSLLILGLGLVTVWDTITTVYGSYIITGEGSTQLIISIFFALFLAAYLIWSIPILKNPSEEIIPVGAKVLWFLAIIYDVFTSYKGNFDLVLGNVGGTEKIFYAIGLTIFVSSAPIGLSSQLFNTAKK